MPSVVQYQIVLESLEARGMKCFYHNSGAFGFPATVATTSRGWIGPTDGSIRREAMSLVRQVDPPFEQRLAALLLQAKQQFLPGPVWAMPKSHWAYELDYGSKDWLPMLLKDIGLDPAAFSGRNDAPAIAFVDGEDALLERFVKQLLAKLNTSDFCLAFVDRGTICTIHSHVQLWWTTTSPAVAVGLDQLLPAVHNAV